MGEYNIAHRQPANVCYRLIGGEFLEAGKKVPGGIRAAYSPYLLFPGDIGVSLRSSRQLGINPFLGFNYPKVSVTTNQDMHGYFNQLGLGDLNSYVRPQATYDQYIMNYIGASMQQCQSTSAPAYAPEIANEESPFISPVLLGGGQLSVGQTVSGSFPVDWSGKSVFYTSWQGGDLDFSLVDSAGNPITPAVAARTPISNMINRSRRMAV